MISFEAPFIGLSLSYSQKCKVYHVQKNVYNLAKNEAVRSDLQDYKRFLKA